VNQTKKTESKPEAASGLKLKTIPLKEQGPKLPLGILGPSGEYHKDIAVRPWRLKEEKELGKLADENREVNVSEHVSMVLATMCTQLGPHNFDKIKFEERRVHIGQMYMGDVFYAYCWLRLQSMGANLSVDITCALCRNKFKFDANVESLEIATAKKVEDAQWMYELKTPIEIRGKQVPSLLMGPARWNTMEMMGTSTMDQGVAKAGIILGSIHKIGSEVITLADGELDDMVKLDIEMLTDHIDNNFLGPNMTIETKCEKCKRELVMPISWSYNNFFGFSSQ